jgi:hypothetical protein
MTDVSRKTVPGAGLRNSQVKVVSATLETQNMIVARGHAEGSGSGSRVLNTGLAAACTVNRVNLLSMISERPSNLRIYPD